MIVDLASVKVFASYCTNAHVNASLHLSLPFVLLINTSIYICKKCLILCRRYGHIGLIISASRPFVPILLAHFVLISI